MALVSVIITTYNGDTRGFLGSAIQSVLRQTFHDIELIIVDDGSLDKTPEVCRELVGPRVKYIRQANAGVGAARNTGIGAASGGFICFLDDDDEWAPTKVERQLEEFRKGSSRLGLVYTAIELIDEAGNVVGLQRHEVPAEPYKSLFFYNFVDAPSSVMVRASVLRQVGKFFNDVFVPAIQGCEDRDLWIRVAREYEIAAVPEPLVQYRLPGRRQQMSRNIAQMEQSELTMLALALKSAPPEIAKLSNSAHSSTLTRIAMEYFAAGEYDTFRDRVRKIIRLGGSSRALLLRFALSFSPPTVRMSRRVARRLAQRGNA